MDILHTDNQGKVWMIPQGCGSLIDLGSYIPLLVPWSSLSESRSVRALDRIGWKMARVHRKALRPLRVLEFSEGANLSQIQRTLVGS